MEAVRCTRCGETRWSLMPDALTHLLAAPCELCGAETTIERRRPGAGHGPVDVERRRLAIAARIAGELPDSSEVAAR